MKPTRVLPLLLACCLPLFVSAQNFSGSDDFSSDLPTWMNPPGQGGGAFLVADGVLSYVDAGLINPETPSSSATRIWVANAGSSVADWQVQMDFTLPSDLPMQIGSWMLNVQNNGDPNDFFSVQLQRTYMNTTPTVQSSITTDTVQSSATNSAPLLGHSATLSLSYTAATAMLTASYDGNGVMGGYSFTSLLSTSVESWNMAANHTFGLSVVANHFVTGGPADPILLGQWTADNFMTNGAAVPEPATVALLAGFAVLGFVVWRRRAG